MVQMRDGVVLVRGLVLDVEQLRNFETKAPDGKRLTIKTDEGFVLVKVSEEDLRVFELPASQQIVAWARPSGWSRDGGMANVTFRWVRPFNGDDLDAIVGAVSRPAPAGK